MPKQCSGKANFSIPLFNIHVWGFCASSIKRKKKGIKMQTEEILTFEGLRKRFRKGLRKRY